MVRSSERLAEAGAPLSSRRTVVSTHHERVRRSSKGPLTLFGPHSTHGAVPGPRRAPARLLSHTKWWRSRDRHQRRGRLDKDRPAEARPRPAPARPRRSTSKKPQPRPEAPPDPLTP